jgi:hypothetical protein
VTENSDMIKVGIQLLQAMKGDNLSRAAAARKLGLSSTEARIRQAAAERYLRHPRNKAHPMRALLERS